MPEAGPEMLTAKSALGLVLTTDPVTVALLLAVLGSGFWALTEDMLLNAAPLARLEGATTTRVKVSLPVPTVAAVAVTPGKVKSISLLPADPPAVPEAVTAILDADWVVFGPGSWFTSVLPHLLVPSLRTALMATHARKLVALNLVAQPGETEGFSQHRHLEVLADHAPSLTFDVVLADAGAVAGAEEELRKAAELLSATLALADVAEPDGMRHDPVRLAVAFRQIFSLGY